jgi:hypothetical protein
VYSCKLYSSAQSIFVNLYDLAIDETSSIKTIKVVGTTNASQVFSIDSSNTSNQIIYTNFIDSASQTVVIIYTYDLSGIYQSSHQIEFPPNVNVSVQDIKSFSSFNRFSIFPNFLPRDTDANIFIYNKDGTLATGTNTYTNDSYNSIVIEYIYNPTYTDVNGVSYSKIVLQKSFNYVPESLVNYYLFIQGNLNNPYEISTIIADNTVLNKNFSIRHNFIENSKDVIILNQLIDVKNIIRKNLSSDQFFGTNWAGNIKAFWLG